MSESNLHEREVERCDWRAGKRSLERNAWLAVAAATYVLALALVRHHPAWSPGWKAAADLTPVLPGLLYVRTGVRPLRDMDELQRRIQFEAWLFAAIGTVIISAVINVFNARGLDGEWLAHGLGVGGTYMIMFILWAVGSTIAKLRYR